MKRKKHLEILTAGGEVAEIEGKRLLLFLL